MSERYTNLPVRLLKDLPVGTAFRFRIESHNCWDPYRSIVLDYSDGKTKYGSFSNLQEHWTDSNKEVILAYGDRLDDWVRKEYPKGESK